MGGEGGKREGERRVERKRGGEEKEKRGKRERGGRGKREEGVKKGQYLVKESNK